MLCKAWCTQKGNFFDNHVFRQNKDKASFVSWLEKDCPHFLTLQELANGTKHCVPVNSTSTIAGYGMGPYGIGPFGKSYLLIDLGEQVPVLQRWLVATDMLRTIVDFWNQFFEQYKSLTR